ncbi:cytochrome c oxidase assembly protein [Vibrio sonorensis]|uniref:cytochrome c oxidase assembly protein n=1 Tax=Vibrio sonorensis TaxID=1004316 RepID=UPI0008D8DDB1|nr:cytochrome c oxidase assembly protein [Vibrio sonorensis]
MEAKKSNRPLTLKLVGATLAMFGFGYALVPLYDVMCEALGINGKTSNQAAEQPSGLTVDKSRTVRVEFIAHQNASMPWEFKPETTVLDVHPGEVIETAYRAFNRSDKTIIGQAVPSVSPGMGASYFNKIECFCFNRQPLDSQQTAELGLIFYIEPDLPKEIHTLTLSYTLYDITSKESADIKVAKATERAQGVTP